MVNDHFTLVSIINSGFVVLVPENSFLTFNISYTSPKTARVYFEVLQNLLTIFWIKYQHEISVICGGDPGCFGLILCLRFDLHVASHNHIFYLTEFER